MGAAYYAWHVVHGGKERFHMQHAFWGPEYGGADIRRALEGRGLAVEEFSNSAPLLERTADLISDGAVVGWHQGRSEWGPRALGCRSILANPQIRTMKDTINAKIKLFDKQIADREFRLDRFQTQLEARFAALENTMARLQAQQQFLSSIILQSGS